MTRKRAALITVVLATAGLAPAVAQVTDFSGTWQIERLIAPSIAPGEGAAPGTVATIARGGSLGIGLSGGFGSVGQLVKSRPPDRLVIAQTALELRIEETWLASVESGSYHRSSVHRLDGTETKHVIPGGQMTTTTAWKDGTLLTTGLRELRGGRGGGFGGGGQVIEARSLSADGQVLTIESTSRSRFGESTTTFIFRRVTGG